MPAVSPEFAAHLIAAEQRLLDPAVRRNSTALNALLATEFCEIGSSGRYFTRAEIFAELADESPRGVTASDFHCTLLAETVALLTYRTVRETLDNSAVHARRSSLWVHEAQGWRVRFHQGTLTAAAD